MILIASDSANADMIKYWNGTGGAAWIARQEAQDADIAFVTGKLLAHADLRPGERISFTFAPDRAACFPARAAATVQDD